MRKKTTITNIIIYKRRQAIKRRIYKEARRQSWINYISTLTSRTPTKQVWEKIRKINGKYIPTPQPSLLVNDNYISDPTKVANIFAFHYTNLSESIPQQPIKLKQTNTTENYNDPLTKRELLEILQHLNNDKTPG